MSTTTIEIVLELDAADHPSGTAAAAGGEPREFHGWLELVSAIGALTACAPPTHPETEGATR